MSQFARHDCSCIVDICCIRLDPDRFNESFLIPFLSTVILSKFLKSFPGVSVLFGSDSVP